MTEKETVPTEATTETAKPARWFPRLKRRDEGPRPRKRTVPIQNDNIKDQQSPAPTDK